LEGPAEAGPYFLVGAGFRRPTGGRTATEMWNGGARKVECAARPVLHHFHDVRVVVIGLIGDGDARRRHLEHWIAHQRSDHSLNRLGLNERLVTLKIHHDFAWEADG